MMGLALFLTTAVALLCCASFVNGARPSVARPTAARQPRFRANDEQQQGRAMLSSPQSTTSQSSHYVATAGQANLATVSNIPATAWQHRPAYTGENGVSPYLAGVAHHAAHRRAQGDVDEQCNAGSTDHDGDPTTPCQACPVGRFSTMGSSCITQVWSAQDQSLVVGLSTSDARSVLEEASPVTLQGGHFSGLVANDFGAAISMAGSDANITHTLFDNNTALGVEARVRVGDLQFSNAALHSA